MNIVKVWKTPPKTVHESTRKSTRQIVSLVLIKHPMKYLTIAFVSLAFLVPSFSYAATIEETRHTLLLQLISLIEQEIASLQAQLAEQEANHSLGSISAPTGATQQIATITHQLNSMPDTIQLDAFSGAVQKDGDRTYVNVVSNKPLDNITGDVSSYEEINGDTVYRNTKNPAYTYEVVLLGEGPSFSLTLISGDEEMTVQK